MRHLGFSWLLVGALLGLGACNEVPKPVGPVEGTIAGVVYISAPVGGVIVSAYGYDHGTGEKGMLIAQSETTGADGHFVVPLGVYYGPVLLEVLGPSGSYIEPATGKTVTFDSATRLRAVYAKMIQQGSIQLDF